MLTALISLVAIFYFGNSFPSRVKRQNALLAFLIFFLYWTIYVFQISSFEYEKGPYFNLLAKDGLRYLYETNFFEKFWLIDEINGTYVDGETEYSVTPKMGLSSFLALFTPFVDIGIEYAYLLMLAASALLACLKIKFISDLDLNNLNKLLLTFVIVFFPMDLYWSFRFLRELISNDILEVLCLYLLSKRGGRRIDKKIVFIFFALLLIWRSQLALLAIPLILVSIGFQGIMFITLLSIASFSQIFKASGASGLSHVGLPDVFIDIVLIFSEPMLSWIAIAAIIMSFMLQKSYYISNASFDLKKVFLLTCIYGGLFAVSSVLFLQIRFWYPVFLLFKLCFSIWFLTKFVFLRKRFLQY